MDTEDYKYIYISVKINYSRGGGPMEVRICNETTTPGDLVKQTWLQGLLGEERAGVLHANVPQVSGGQTQLR